MTTSAAGADAHVSGVTRWERGAYALAGLLALSATILSPLVRAVDPVLACVISYAGDSSLAYQGVRLEDQGSGPAELAGSSDPWGRPWRYAPGVIIYSAGADGVDASGGGDDVTTEDLYGSSWRAWVPRVILGAPSLMLAVTALTLAAWTLVTHEALRAPRGRLAVEVRRAASIAAGPAMIGVVWSLAGIPRLVAESGAGRFVQLPASVAIPLTWALACCLPALAWRLTRPRAPETPPI